MNTSDLIKHLSNAAITAVMPEVFIPAQITRDGGILTIQDVPYDLDAYRHVYVISLGKAAIGMAEALDQIIHPYVTEAIVLTKHIPQRHSLGDQYRILRGNHPIPGTYSIAGAKAVLEIAEKAGADDLVIFLISGGGSALMSLPVEGIDLETMQRFSDMILSCGANITEFNILRKHLDLIKGGRLAQHAAPADQVTIILSDVVGDPVDIIASGPTVPDPYTYQDALEILDRYAAVNTFPPVIHNILMRGMDEKLPETPKPDDPLFQKSNIYLAASNRTAAAAAALEAQKLGFHAQVLNTQLTGEASEIGKLLPSFFSTLDAPGMYIFGGETTVHITGNGLGGRNLELALGSVREMADWKNCVLATLATDGEDGPTDAAGAFVTADMIFRAIEEGITPESFLRNNDAYHFFERVKGLIRTGPSGTNVCDLTFLIRMS